MTLIGCFKTDLNSISIGFMKWNVLFRCYAPRLDNHILSAVISVTPLGEYIKPPAQRIAQDEFFVNHDLINVIKLLRGLYSI